MGRITASSKTLQPDPKYGSKLLMKFVNSLMRDGEKQTALAVVYDALAVIKERMPNEDELDVFTRAIDNVRPEVEVRSRRIGGAAYQVPMQVKGNRQQSLAIRWVLSAVREKKGRATYLKLADELIAAYNREGTAYTKRENVHRMADANKAFAHFAW